MAKYGSEYELFKNGGSESSKEVLLTVDQAAFIFSKVIGKIMTFDDEQDKVDYLLDAVIEYKKEAIKFNYK